MFTLKYKEIRPGGRICWYTNWLALPDAFSTASAARDPAEAVTLRDSEDPSENSITPYWFPGSLLTLYVCTCYVHSANREFEPYCESRARKVCLRGELEWFFHLRRRKEPRLFCYYGAILLYRTVSQTLTLSATELRKETSECSRKATSVDK